eukprot:CAMPEP_0201140690 /NCGR_PEP_ID=MMETSP0851-20130426/2283_1 /ASSEMBLY_ACC=CAM_ASM_000631 /TAXON_ID=183588 /ORGANISM="Pseudo-nitzschia fraudulenta, Strain WWA7" /LENGTH=79 /DNA_ID=CAMNT_0047413373 /DNA_START=21 /DNA_END=260 /DNA_ORIENTATION=-
MQVEREARGLLLVESGERVSNAWATHPVAGDNSGKPELIPNVFTESLGLVKKEGQLSPLDRPASHQLVGVVTAHQGNDG